MKHTVALLGVLLLTPLAAFAQAKPEVANATKAAKRAWESAPAEKQALWLQQREALTHIDIADDTKRQIVIVQGTPEEYHAHPTTALLADDKTMFCVWNIGHGGQTPSLPDSDSRQGGGARGVRGEFLAVTFFSIPEKMVTFRRLLTLIHDAR